MPRSTNLKELTLNIKPDPPQETTPTNTTFPRPPRPDSSPMALQGVDLSSFAGDYTSTDFPSFPMMSTSPTSPPSGSPKHSRDPSKTMWNNLKLHKPVNNNKRLPDAPPDAEGGSIRQVKDDEGDRRPGNSGAAKIYHLRNAGGSTPELSLIGSTENVDRGGLVTTRDRRPKPDPRPRISPQNSSDGNIGGGTAPAPGDGAQSKRKEKTFRNPLSRTKSVSRRDSNSKQIRHQPLDYAPAEDKYPQAPRTAPLHNPDWHSSTDNVLRGKAKDRRGKSVERPNTQESEENLHGHYQQSHKGAGVGREKEKNAFVTSSKNVMNKAVTGGGNLLNRLGKIGRSSSATSDPEVSDTQYRIKVLNLPLVEQTRKTRISKDMGTCRDKTEFWMPALPWRCIDYLNLNCEVEGLYRIPGSVPQIKKWQRKFDTEGDVNIFDITQGYDEHEIASVLKAWLRELPNDIFPKELQYRLTSELEAEDPDFRTREQVPQRVRDTLSNLPPFNYYLLFAITCHLSLLLSHQDKNKMSLENLAICIGPCLNLEHWLFNFLVGDWRHCWQGCYVEQEYLEAERAWANGEEPPSSSAGLSDEHSQSGSTNDQAVSSDEGSKAGSAFGDARSNLDDLDDPLKSSRGLERIGENTRPNVYEPSGYGRYGARTPDRQLQVQDTRRKLHLDAPDIRRPSAAEGSEQLTPRDNSRNRALTSGAAYDRSRSEAVVTPTPGADAPAGKRHS